MSDGTVGSDFDKAIEVLLGEIGSVHTHYKALLDKYRAEPDEGQRKELRKKIKQLDDEISGENILPQDAEVIKMPKRTNPHLNQ